MDIIATVLILLALAGAVEHRHRRTASSGRIAFTPRGGYPGGHPTGGPDADARRLAEDLRAAAQRQDCPSVRRWAGLLAAAATAVPFEQAPPPVGEPGVPDARAWGRGSPPGSSGRAARAELLRLRGPNGSPRSAR